MSSRRNIVPGKAIGISNVFSKFCIAVKEFHFGYRTVSVSSSSCDCHSGSFRKLSISRTCYRHRWCSIRTHYCDIYSRGCCHLLLIVSSLYCQHVSTYRCIVPGETVGLVKSSPSLVVPLKNSTLVTEPLASAAVAVIVIGDPLVNWAPFEGDVIETVGGVFTAAHTVIVDGC